MEHPDPLEHVTFRGATMDRKTAAFLAVMEQRLGYELTVLQGSYRPRTSYSAGTHMGGGVVDLAFYDWERKVKIAIDLGAFAWHRPAISGLWGEHIHLGIKGHQTLSPEAKEQEKQFVQGLNGLADHGRDPNTYRPKVDNFNYVLWYRDGLLEQRIKGLQARRKQLLDKISAARSRYTYRK